MYLNIRGLRSKMEKIQFTLNEKNINPSSLNKRFLNSKIKIDIPECHIIRNDSSTGKGGGVALLTESEFC